MTNACRFSLHAVTLINQYLLQLSIVQTFSCKMCHVNWINIFWISCLSDLGYCSEAVITAFIKKFVPKATVAENIGTEISYQLPLTSARNQQLSKMFRELEMNMDKLYISSYGLSDTSLEEVSSLEVKQSWYYSANI